VDLHVTRQQDLGMNVAHASLIPRYQN
jgi:hypothetical protein